MPAIRRTPPGPEADEQDTALHKVGTLAYFLPIALTPTLWLFGSLVALAARVALFDLVLALAERKPLFSVGYTAKTDKLIRWLASKVRVSAELVSVILRLAVVGLIAALLSLGLVPLAWKP